MADIPTTIVEKVMDTVTDLIAKIAGPAAEEIGLTIQDSIRVYRAKRQYRLLQKIRQFVDEAGFEPRQVPLKLLLPSMDYASVEEDEDLHTAWAALLANAANPDMDQVPPAFPEILRQLAPCDAKLFRQVCLETMERALPIEREHYPEQELICRARLGETWLFAAWARLGYAKTGSHPLTIAEQHSEMGIQRKVEERRFGVALRNLIRLGLMEPEKHLKISMPQMHDIEKRRYDNSKLIPHESFETFRVTVLGYQFLEVCAYPDKRKRQ